MSADTGQSQASFAANTSDEGVGPASGHEAVLEPWQPFTEVPPAAAAPVNQPKPPTLRIAFYRHERDDLPIVDDPSWEELAGVLGVDGAWEGPCALGTCAGHVCPYKMRSPRGVSAWSPVRLVDGGTRANKNVLAITALVLDLDGVDPAILAEVARHLEGWRYVAHSTHADRFSLGGPASLRVAVALEAEVPAASWRDYRLAAIARLGLDDPRFKIDPTCKDASRLYFLPSRPIGYEPIYERGEGAVLPLSLVPPVRAVVLPALAPPAPPVAIEPVPVAVDIGQLRRALAEHRRSLAHQADEAARKKADLLGRVLASEPIAEPGARGSTIYRLASICAFCWPVGTPVEAFVEVIRPSMAATSTAPTPGDPTQAPVDHWAHAADCYRRAAAQREQKEAAEVQRNQELRDGLGGRASVVEASTVTTPGAGAQHQGSAAGRLAVAGLAVGSDVEVGRRMLVDLRGGNAQPIVFDRGAFFEYVPTSGVWTEIETARLERAVHALDGLRIGPRRVYTANDHRVRGAIRRASADVARPGFFDAHADGIGFTNGFLRVSRDGAVLHPHSPDFRLTATLPFAYDRYACAPFFSRAIYEWFYGEIDAQQKVDLLQEFVGACMIGVATQYQKAIVLVGEGANGKSVFLTVVRALFPINTLTAIPPQDLGQEYRRAMLAHSRLNAVSEIPEADILESEAFKAIITGDAITGRHIRAAPFSFRPHAGHLFGANKLPGTNDQTYGFWRRLIPVLFNHIIDESRADKELDQKIIATELPAMAVWAIDGAVRLLARGTYVMPESTKAAHEEWKRRADQVRQFFEERLVVVTDPQATTGKRLYEAYKAWAGDNGHKVMNNNNFADRLINLKLGIQKTRTGVGRFWNVVFKPEEPMFVNPNARLALPQ